MAVVETKYIFNGNIEKVFQGLIKYDLYPKYLPGMTGVKILPPESKGAVCQVRYELNIVKTFFYTLEMFHDEPTSITWNLIDSNLMKKSTGSWTLSKVKGGKTTEGAYLLDITFKGFVPSMITDPIAKANLPVMFAGFQKLIDENT